MITTFGQTYWTAGAFLPVAAGIAHVIGNSRNHRKSHYQVEERDSWFADCSAAGGRKDQRMDAWPGEPVTRPVGVDSSGHVADRRRSSYIDIRASMTRWTGRRRRQNDPHLLQRRYGVAFSPFLHRPRIYHYKSSYACLYLHENITGVVKFRSGKRYQQPLGRPIVLPWNILFVEI